MKKIERPNFYDFFKSIDDDKMKNIARSEFSYWFDTNLKDHYAVHKDDLVRVYSVLNSSATGTDVSWFPEIINHSTHQAYLIKSSIEPIKKCEHRPCHHARCLGALICEKCGVKLKPTGWTEVSE